MEILKSGGPLMYAIVLAAIIGVVVVMERIFYFLIAEKGSYDKIKEELLDYVEKDDFSSAKELCIEQNNSVGKILETIIDTKDSKREFLDEKIKEVVLSQVPQLESGMWILNTIVHITPLLGLLGTVTGMIKAFSEISANGVGNPEGLAGGISQALITTAAGLGIAIPLAVFYNMFNSRIDNIINDMEKAAVEFLNTIGR